MTEESDRTPATSRGEGGGDAQTVDGEEGGEGAPQPFMVPPGVSSFGGAVAETDGSGGPSVVPFKGEGQEE